MINTIIFDFDGTLVNTNDVVIDAWQHTYRHYLGCEKPKEHITKCFGEPLLITMEREFPDVDVAISAEVYRERQREKADELVRLFPQIEELLVGLKEKGFKMGIVTSRTREATLFYLDKFGIADYFDEVVTCDDTSKHKPDPEPVLLGLKKLNAKAEETLMIGDSHFDMQCANGAFVKTVLVGWRMTSDKEKMDQCQVDYHIENPMELLNIFEEM